MRTGAVQRARAAAHARIRPPFLARVTATLLARAASACLATILVAPGVVAQEADAARADTAGAGAAAARAPIPVLIVSGQNNHDWRWTTPSLRSILEESGRFTVEVTTTPAETLADAESLSRFDALVLDYNDTSEDGRWGEAAEAGFLAAVEGGTGVVVIHAANNAFVGWTEYERLVGHLWRAGTGHGAFHPFDVTITDRDHPVTRDLPDLVAHPDELYHRLWEAPGHGMRVLATARSATETGGTGDDEPMIMVGRFGAGRVFHTPLGHVWRNNEASRASHADPQFRDLVVRGTEWAATGEVTVPPPVREASARRDESLFDVLARQVGADRVVPLLSDPAQDGPAGPGLAGWRALGDAAWSREGDTLTGRVDGGSQSFLVGEEVFGDFVLEVELRNLAPGNSGIQVRSHVRDDGVLAGYQIEIDPSERAWSGGLYDEARRGWLDDLSDHPEARAAFRPGEWNRYTIACLGPHIRSWVNGVPAADHLDGLDLSGHVAFQVHSGDDTHVQWRNPRLLALGTSAWTPLFDGTDTDALRFDGALELGADGRPPIEDGVLRLRTRGAARVGLPTGPVGTLRVRYREAGGVLFVGCHLEGAGVPADVGRREALWREEGVGTLAWPRAGERGGQWRQLELHVFGTRAELKVDGDQVASLQTPPGTGGPWTLEVRSWGEGEVQLRDVSWLPGTPAGR